MAKRLISRKHTLLGFISFQILMAFIFLVLFYFFPVSGGILGIPGYYIIVEILAIIGGIAFWFSRRK